MLAGHLDVGHVAGLQAADAPPSNAGGVAGVVHIEDGSLGGHFRQHSLRDAAVAGSGRRGAPAVVGYSDYRIAPFVVYLRRHPLVLVELVRSHATGPSVTVTSMIGRIPSLPPAHAVKVVRVHPAKFPQRGAPRRKSLDEIIVFLLGLRVSGESAHIRGIQSNLRARDRVDEVGNPSSRYSP